MHIMCTQIQWKFIEINLPVNLLFIYCDTYNLVLFI